MIERAETNDHLCVERQELRYVMPLEVYSEVVDILNRDFEVIPYEEKINRTIYFNNSVHEIPWGCSLRARKYLPNKISGSTLSLDDNYFVEIKKTDNQIKSKERFNSKLDFASLHLRETTGLELSEPIRPYFLVEYERKHFLPKDKKQNIRITLDNCPNYHLIDDNLGLREIGRELVTRLEIKSSNEDFISNNKGTFRELSKLDIFPSISKKIAACNYEKKMLKLIMDKLLIKDLLNMEIESKMIVNDSNPYVFFNRLILDYRKGIGNFVIDSKVPYIIESGGINYYYRNSDDFNSEGMKILTYSSGAKLTIKSNTELINDVYGFDCILKRSEIKGKIFPLRKKDISDALSDDSDLNLVGLVQRTRKVVYLSSNTGRIYHVSIDNCVDLNDKNKSVYQLEIEYSGFLNKDMENKGSESVVIGEISELTRDIISKYPGSVIPKPLRKIDWIAKNK